ncbi:Flagellum site-determining protein YlxH [Candidatus Xiphinematobacter sp. Idaho Grape]|uniref:Mrp/NBP35 family ATP-binding protein n=1 Tax=Candidatus Xiphinematobacter sp. Idaho Grape TaxID=1704307 RepID=UPI0007065E88|nr:Mrp/NBP35 family ATP-binding protein [Candidatus Xiphinematobacter sp. Idaho Grape]ALJ56994.1 Flagellum site-determining protein YlxH [Candidatus Xiphinematobacter sp. Idaho Grape]
MPSEGDVRKALRTVKYPGFNRDIVSFGLLKTIEILNGDVHIELDVTTEDVHIPEKIQVESERAIATLPGVGHVRVNVKHQSRTRPTHGPTAIEDVQYVVAVASGKGGVGKSTVATNTAVALHHTGARVGLCDCDIYGPSIALMFGSKERPCIDKEKDRLLPIERYGIKLMSMGFLLGDEKTPVVLRAPIVTRYVQQFLRQVHWSGLDYLILDLPPGTGDIQLTVVQTVSLSGAIIVTTPQEVALLDARKAVSMFVKTQVSILGIVENMSYFLCPGDGKKYEIFGRGGGAREACRLGIPLLAEIPVQPDVCITGDSGHPIMRKMPHSIVAQSFLSLAHQIRERLEKETNRESR